MRGIAVSQEHVLRPDEDVQDHANPASAVPSVQLTQPAGFVATLNSRVALRLGILGSVSKGIREYRNVRLRSHRSGKG